MKIGYYHNVLIIMNASLKKLSIFDIKRRKLILFVNNTLQSKDGI
jgi:hypothetical protein